MNKRTFSIPNMHCSNCVMRLEGIEDDLPGILKIKASYIHQSLEVQYDASLVSEAQISAAIHALGYDIAG